MGQNNPFQWECQPKAEDFILKILDECCRKNPFIAELQENLLKHTSTRLFDWLDHVVVGYSPSLDSTLDEAGFVSDHAAPYYRIFHHPGAQLPRVVVKDHDNPVVGVAIKVDSI